TLWKSTGLGIELLKDFGPPVYLSSLNFSGLTSFGGALYFSTFDSVAGVELWRSDGTPAGTARFADLNPGGSSSSPGELTVVGGRRFLFAADDLAGRELWILDPGSVCGNGTLDPGEECDDGNNASGDCCAGNCARVADGTPCPDTDPCTVAETCLAGACRTQPAPAACIDHYLCYRARSSQTFAPVLDVALSDAFES